MTEMNQLYETAALMRTEQDREEMLGHVGHREHKTWMAVADWLDDCGHLVEYGDIGPVHKRHAFTVARAYLGRPA